MGIETSHIIRDPISSIYCSPVPWKDRTSQLVALGNISWQKNTQQLVQLFKALKGKVERVYAGSHSLWRSDDQDASAIRLQNELYEHCDKVIPECTISELAKLFYKSRYGAWVATHDTTSTATISMFRAGIPVVGAAHGYADEIPVRTARGLWQQVKAVEDMVEMSDEEMGIWSEYVSDWCEKNVSYPAFIDQLNSVMRTVWT